jgi:hypothetical protein
MDLAALWGRKEVFEFLQSVGGTITLKFRRVMDR